MSTVLPVLLFALAGMLAGGAWSMRRQGASPRATGLVVVLGVLALVGGVLWMLPGGD